MKNNKWVGFKVGFGNALRCISTIDAGIIQGVWGNLKGLAACGITWGLLG